MYLYRELQLNCPCNIGELIKYKLGKLFGRIQATLTNTVCKNTQLAFSDTSPVNTHVITQGKKQGVTYLQKRSPTQWNAQESAERLHTTWMWHPIGKSSLLLFPCHYLTVAAPTSLYSEQAWVLSTTVLHIMQIELSFKCWLNMDLKTYLNQFLNSKFYMPARPH